MTEREELLFNLCMALRKVPPAIFRDMGKRRRPGDDLPEKMAAEKIHAHLKLADLELTRSRADTIGWAPHAVSRAMASPP